MNPGIINLPPNRVWRTYAGGRTLDALAGVASPADSHFPEDWIASTTRAVNTGREHIYEGVSQVSVEGRLCDLQKLIAEDPEYFLGAEHLNQFGAEPMLLVKYIDCAVRLHMQVHPTTAFARERLGAPFGKAEAYYVLSNRPEVEDPCVYLGLRKPLARADLKRMIENQEIDAFQDHMNRVSVRPGDTLFVPGGTPHALGEGLFLIEIQEPSDLVVRFEFERNGYRLPESARYMGRDLDFCLDVFDLTPFADTLKKIPREIRRFSSSAWQEELLGSENTTSFRLTRSHFGEEAVKEEKGFCIAIVTEGEGELSAHGVTQPVKRYDKVLLPAGLGPVKFAPKNGALTILECHPPSKFQG